MMQQKRCFHIDDDVPHLRASYRRRKHCRDYHGQKICAVVRRGNVFGCQFHPEKSGEVGLSIIRGYLKL